MTFNRYNLSSSECNDIVHTTYHPPCIISSTPTLTSQVSSSAVVLDCVTLSHYSSSGVLLRFYESFGSTISTRVSLNRALNVASVKEVNILETPLAELRGGRGAAATGNGYSFILHFTPFQMKTVIVTLL